MAAVGRGALAALALALAAAYAWHVLQGPMYVPGGVAEAVRNDAAPFVTEDGLFFEVEPGVRLRFFESRPGEGLRRAVVVHGGPGAPGGVWEAAAHSPLSGFNLVFYDQRGCGLSTRPFDEFPGDGVFKGLGALHEGLGIGVQLADLDRVRRALGEERLLLIGHSYGGFLAAMYAAEFPDRVERMVLVSPAPLVVFPPPNGDGIFGKIRDELRRDEDRGRFDEWMGRYMDFGGLDKHNEASMLGLQRGFAEFFELATGVDLNALPSHKRRARVTGGADAGDTPGGWMPHAQYLGLGRRHDYSAALREGVTAPTLVVHGAHDFLQTAAESRVYLDYIERAPAELRVIDTAGHCSGDEAPAEFARLVGEFLA